MVASLFCTVASLKSHSRKDLVAVIIIITEAVRIIQQDRQNIKKKNKIEGAERKFMDLGEN